MNGVAWIERFHIDHLPPFDTYIDVHTYVATSVLLLCEMYEYELLLNLYFIDVLLGSTNDNFNLLSLEDNDDKKVMSQTFTNGSRQGHQLHLCLKIV